ncbi:Riboflavin biosynthesis protein RibF [Chlamydia avium]|nr:bifunctional riboflavin kinase/FAD synthetase [Chlamydia avium]EPP37122.1 riboflavin biosynthesis protein RibF [Chlamydia psittaci 10_743_SC13]EPP38195.1 riboflavin biosynthesis protein RibF [Chlamydia avium]VVT42748.1 Riboflavin biosynthesis protein RibF [Chlamydia avium]
MEIFYSLASIPFPIDSITIGFFDGCHLGHTKLLNLLSSYPGTSGIITFDVHPLAILQPPGPQLIISKDEKLRRLQNFPIDCLCILPFTKSFSNQSAESFILSLHETLCCKRLVLGYDSHLGKDRLGNAKTLLPLADTLGIEIIEVSPCEINHEIVSSKKIRQFLSQGDLESANSHLGYTYTYSGTITSGRGLGTKLGIATINLPQQECLLPFGVYACEVEYNKQFHLGIMNLGLAPTVGRNSLCLEAHIFDFQENIYNQTVSIIPKQLLRREKKFSSREELAQAIRQDIQDARRFFSSTNYVRKA